MDEERIILFGACDRHNLGDMLFPHVLAAMLGEGRVAYAGVAERDLTPFGGHPVAALARLAGGWADRPAHVVHAGGEILTVDAWQAAVMVLAPLEAKTMIGLYEPHRQGRLRWAQEYLGIRYRAAYVPPRALFRNPGRFVFNAVGGVDLDRLDAELRDEVVHTLRAAAFVGAREPVTLEHLRRAGIEARLMPDAVVMVAELFGERIRQHARSGEPAAVRSAFPQGYLAVQFSADFGDDATLAAIAAQLDRAAAASGFAVVLFRAGAAPWHDDVECYRRAAGRMKSTQVRIFDSLDIWDICALIAASAGYCGSSLHGRIVALTYGLPRVSLLHPALASSPATKQGAFIAAWEAQRESVVVPAQRVADGLIAALAQGRDETRGAAHRLAARYREGFAEWRGLLPR